MFSFEMRLDDYWKDQDILYEYESKINFKQQVTQVCVEPPHLWYVVPLCNAVPQGMLFLASLQH